MTITPKEPFASDPIQLTALWVWREARGCAYEAKLGVVWTLRNRCGMAPVLGFANDMAGNILKPWVFSSFNANDPNPQLYPNTTSPAWEDCLKAANSSEIDPDPTGGAVFYFSKPLTEASKAWRDVEVSAVIDCLTFCRLRPGVLREQLYQNGNQTAPLERPGWRISDRVCSRSDHERHLAHIVRLGDKWLAFDGTRSGREGNRFLFLGSFARKETAMDAAEDGARLVGMDRASPRGRAIPKALQFRTHLPMYSLAAAAGKFGEQQTEVNPEGWVEVSPSPIRNTRDMFVTHIEGRSMEPTIPDGSLCAFRSNVSAPYDGKIVLMEYYGDVGGNRYAVKRYRTSMNADPNKEGLHGWLHERITLESINPDCSPVEVASSEKVNVIGEFVFTIPHSDNQSRLRASL
jgi:hypothetical protein